MIFGKAADPSLAKADGIDEGEALGERAVAEGDLRYGFVQWLQSDPTVLTSGEGPYGWNLVRRRKLLRERVGRPRRKDAPRLTSKHRGEEVRHGVNEELLGSGTIHPPPLRVEQARVCQSNDGAMNAGVRHSQLTREGPDRPLGWGVRELEQHDWVLALEHRARR
jgi:hypothetical protein